MKKSYAVYALAVSLLIAISTKADMTSPSWDQTFDIGKPVYVAWNTTLPYGQGTIPSNTVFRISRYIVDGYPVYDDFIVMGLVTNTFEYDWNTPQDLPVGMYRIQVEYADSNGDFQYYDDVEFNVLAPSLSITSLQVQHEGTNDHCSIAVAGGFLLGDYAIETSTNLMQWTNASEFMNEKQFFGIYVDHAEARYFRCKLLNELKVEWTCNPPHPQPGQTYTLTAHASGSSPQFLPYKYKWIDIDGLESDQPTITETLGDWPRTVLIVRSGQQIVTIYIPLP